VAIFSLCIVALGLSVHVQAAGKKPRSTPKNPQVAASDSKLRIDAIQPLFLNAIPDKQTIHIVGNFPDGTTIRGNTPLSLVDKEESIATGEVFVNIHLTDTKQQRVFLTLENAGDSKSIEFEVSPACGGPPSNAQDLSSTLTPPGGARCTLPPDDKFVAFNAMTGELTDKGTSKFCKNSSDSVESTFDIKSTYRSTKERVHFVVCNKNPFNYTVEVTKDEKPIQNDDLSTFLGVLVPGLGASQAAKSASDTAAQKATNSSTTKAVNPQNNKPLEPEKPGQPSMSITFAIADPIQGCLNDIVGTLQELDVKYTSVVQQFQISEAKLQDDDLECQTRLTEAQSLWKSAKALSIDPTTQNTNQRINALRMAVDARIASATTGPYAGNDLTKQQIASMKAVEKALDVQECVSSKAAQIVATQLQKNVVVPLEAILGNNKSFVYSTYFGPYQQPTNVNWTIKSSQLDKSKGLSAGSDMGTDPYYQCFGGQNPKDGNQNGDNQNRTPATGGPASPGNVAPTSGQGVVSNNAASGDQGAMAISDYERRNNSLMQRTSFTVPSEADGSPGEVQEGPSPAPKQKKSTNSSAPSSASASSDTKNSSEPTSTSVAASNASGTYTFGGPRIVVSAGIAAALLRNRQYQKVQASGQSSGTTIEYSTNSAIRMSPLIMAHGKIVQFKGSENGIWATVGVTAASNNQGVSPEYFLGGTVSFLSNWLFLSPGLYIGQSQTLTGGYSVGQQLPSSFTGTVPTQQSYKAGFGIGVSFRVPGTAAPKTKDSNSNGSGSKSKGNAKTSPQASTN
jgi:hypothetical protein